MTDDAVRNTPKCETCGAGASDEPLAIAHCLAAQDLEAIRRHLTVTREIDGRVVVDFDAVAMQEEIRALRVSARKLIDEIEAWFLPGGETPTARFVLGSIGKFRAAIDPPEET
ncbi:MAG: hypothetical protein KJ007_03020 [Burkholderiales bacterium]|nr:hypothetical protein [Burkholderiales bacterium]